MKKRYHYTEQYILTPQHKVTIHLVGVGGTGSQVLSALARINKGLQALRHPGIHVRCFDPDTVSIANIGRQMFSAADLGFNKATCAVTRINRFFGFDWEADAALYDARKNAANILITCTDSAKSRLNIATEQKCFVDTQMGPMTKRYYWVDFGNLKTTGQVVLGTNSQDKYRSVEKVQKRPKLPKANDTAELPTALELLDFENIDEQDQGPSCSLAEAIGRQDLFINSTLAQLGCNLLWKLFTKGKIDYHGVYLNLDTMQTRPIPV